MPYFFQWDAINKKWVFSTTGGAPFSDVVDNPTIETLTGNGISAPSVSASGKCKLYFDASTKKLRISQDGAAYIDVINPFVSPLTTKGDVFVYGSTNDRLPVGTSGYVIEADSAQSLGLKWAAKTPLTTKGDIQVYGSAVDRLPIGTNNYLLVADSAQSLGMRWGGLQCGRWKNTTGGGSAASYTIPWDTEQINSDTNLFVRQNSNTEIKITQTGYYLVAYGALCTAAAGTGVAWDLYQNTSVLVSVGDTTNSGGFGDGAKSILLSITANDYIKLTLAAGTHNSTYPYNFMSIVRIG